VLTLESRELEKLELMLAK
jgi:hypothetical protein